MAAAVLCAVMQTNRAGATTTATALAKVLGNRIVWSSFASDEPFRFYAYGIAPTDLSRVLCVSLRLRLHGKGTAFALDAACGRLSEARMRIIGSYLSPYEVDAEASRAHLAE
jgi:hypothetical protein